MFCNIVGPKFTGCTDVQRNFTTYFNLLTNKVASMFLWKNLPETIDERFLEFTLLLKGRVAWFEHEGKLYALDGNVGGEPNAYYEPTLFIIANPVIGSKQLKVRNKDGSNSVESLDGILMANSDVDYEDQGTKGGLYGLIYQTAGLLADNISSLNISQINGRLAAIFSTSDEAIARTAEVVLKEIYDGKPYKILTEDITDKITVNPIAASGQNNTLMSLIQGHQYILAQFFNEIGITSNWNCKRERLNTAEVEMNEGCLDINIFNMLRNRRQAVELINQKFGTNIEVELNDSIYDEFKGNADAESEEATDEPTPEEEAMGAATTEAEDDDFQTEGVKEDVVEVEENRSDKLEETVDEEISQENENEED